MRSGVFLVAAMLVCLAGSSCNNKAGSVAANTATRASHIQQTGQAPRPRVTPMIYDGWRARDFQYIGLRVDLPTQAHDSPSGKGPAKLSFSMHYLSPPPGVLDDATVFVDIYVERMTLEQFAEQKASYLRSGLYKRGNEEDHKFWFWYYDFHPETCRWDDTGNYSSYRRDVKLNDKEILHTHVEVLNAGPQESRDADHAAVKRILDSIEPLNATPNK